MVSEPRADGLIPDADNIVLPAFDGGEFVVGLGEGTAYLSFDYIAKGETEPALIAVYEPRSDVEDVRRLGKMLLAWADAWQDEYDRFLYAEPCGINLAPGATTNPACKGDHDENGVCVL